MFKFGGNGQNFVVDELVNRSQDLLLNIGESVGLSERCHAFSSGALIGPFFASGK